MQQSSEQGEGGCEHPWKDLQPQRPWLPGVRPHIPIVWGSQSSSFRPLQQYPVSASYHNGESWEEAKPCLCPKQRMCSLSWDSNLRQSWACGEFGQETQDGFLFYFLLAFESHSKIVVFNLITILKLVFIWESRKEENKMCRFLLWSQMTNENGLKF